jgi:hypothetical protein
MKGEKKKARQTGDLIATPKHGKVLIFKIKVKRFTACGQFSS